MRSTRPKPSLKDEKLRPGNRKCSKSHDTASSSKPAVLFWSLGFSAPSLHHVLLSWALLSLSLRPFEGQAASAPAAVSAARMGTAGELPHAAYQTQPCWGSKALKKGFLPSPSHTCPEDPQASLSLWVGWVLPALLVQSPPSPPRAELAWT